MDLINAKKKILTMQLLAVCIFQSEGMASKIAGLGIDVIIGSLGTAN